MPLEHCSGATPVNAKAAAHVKVRNSTKFRGKKKEERRETCVSIQVSYTSHPTG